MFFNSSYLIFVMVPSLLLMGFAQWRLRSTFSRYSQIPNSRGLTGAQAADAVMRASGVYDVGIEAIPGALTDHFDPRAKVLRLSEPVYNSRSMAAIGVAAHE